MRKLMKRLALGVALLTMITALTGCGEDKDVSVDADVKVDTDVKVETGDIEVDADVEVETGDIEADTDVSVNTGDRIRIDKYIGGTGKEINNAGYKYVGISGRDGDYVVQYVMYDIEPEIKKEFYELQGSNIAKILIRNNNVGLGYKPNGDKYLFTLNSGSVYMNFELVGSEQIFEQYKQEEFKKIRDMGELHSIPIINLQIEYMYCYAKFDEAGTAIITTDNFNDETAQQMLSGCVVEDFYYEYGLAD